MPRTDGVTATARISARHPEVRVIVLTTFDSDEYAFGALDAGASGFLLKDVEGVELIRAVRAVAAGDAVLSPRITREVLARRASEPRSLAEPDPAEDFTRARSTCSARSRAASRTVRSPQSSTWVRPP